MQVRNYFEINKGSLPLKVFLRHGLKQAVHSRETPQPRGGRERRDSEGGRMNPTPPPRPHLPGLLSSPTPPAQRGADASVEPFTLEGLN